MTLLYSLFPSLEKHNHGNEIPTWPDKNKPWSIISVSGEESLSKQIMNLKLTYPKRIENSNYCLDDTGGPIYIHPTAEIGEFVKIEGPAYIGKNAKIRHSAYLRKGSWICNNAVVGHSSEIKNSILLPGAKAPHFNYVGDSILGFNVNIGAGAIFCINLFVAASQSPIIASLPTCPASSNIDVKGANKNHGCLDPGPVN